MRLSDAIALGRTLGPSWTRNDQNGLCAMMMAGAAANGSSWNWTGGLDYKIETYVDLPCSCKTCCDHPWNKYAGWFPRPEKMFFHSAIIHLYNFHVTWKGDWTLDQLIDWVRGVEETVETVPVPIESKEEVPVHAMSR